MAENKKYHELRDICKEWLESHGYDGLYDPYECGCELSDLMPCGEPHPDCTAGYKSVADPATGYDFMIGPEKKEE
jgi:hypothetical protein